MELDGQPLTTDNCGDTTAASTDIVTVELDGIKSPAVGNTAVVLPDCTTWQVPGKTINCESNPGSGWPFSPSAIPATTSKCDCGQVTIPVTPINPTISASKTPSPTSLVEPGGAITYTVGVTNIMCSVPQTLAQNGSLSSCSFQGSVTGTEPTTSKDTVTVHGVGGGASVSAQASATVSIGEAAASAQVLKSLDGGFECATARYKLEVDNLSAGMTDETETLTALRTVRSATSRGSVRQFRRLQPSLLLWVRPAASRVG